MDSVQLTSPLESTYAEQGTIVQATDQAGLNARQRQSRWQMSMLEMMGGCYNQDVVLRDMAQRDEQVC